jgi:hypothetical protein
MSVGGRFRRHASSLRSAVSTPSDAWLLVRMLGWSAVLPVAKRTLPLPQLVRLMHSRRHASQRDPELEATIALLAAWVFKTRPPGARDNCFERALVAYRYLSRAGASPQLVVGIGKETGATHGHMWVAVDGRAVHDSPGVLAGFEPVLAFESDGTLIRTGTSSGSRS